MIANRRLLLHLMVIMFVLFVNDPLSAQEKEDLLFQEIPIVITAARKAQPITEAPTSISIITSEDIKYSGADTIPDILRMVAGVDVMAISARDQQVAIRGLGAPLHNKLLVMVDGRSVYEDIYGVVLWDTLPVGLSEIQRIEIVKSPSSSIYGANAYSGVINIITKTPDQLDGTHIKLTGGTQDTLVGSVIHAKAGKHFSYKVSSVYRHNRQWGDTDENAGNIVRFNAWMEYKLNEKTSFTFSGGRGDVKGRRAFTGEFVGNQIMDHRTDYLRMDARLGSVQFRSFLKKQRTLTPWFEDVVQNWTLYTCDSEILHSFRLTKGLSLVWGGNFRFNHIKKNIVFRKDYRQRLWGLFLEGEQKISDKLRFTVGCRYDYHPLVGDYFSPRGNIIYTPDPHHVFRFSVARAFRNPTLGDSYLFIEQWGKITLLPPFPPIEMPYVYRFTGNESIDPEDIVAYEIAYNAMLFNNLRLGVNFFYSRYNNFFVRDAHVNYYAANELFPGSPGDVFINEVTFTRRNGSSADGLGGEISLEYSPSKQISSFINYSYQQITDREDVSSTMTIDEKNRIRTAYPKHKLNAGLRILFKKGFSFNCLAHWVDKTLRPVDDGNGDMLWSEVSDYLMINARVGYTFWNEKAELSLAAFNLFDDSHYEYPPETAYSTESSVKIGRKVTFSLRYSF